MMVSSSSLINRVQVIAIFMLCVSTILLSNMIDRYEVIGDELLVNNNFDNKFKGWHKSGNGIAVSEEMQPVVQLQSRNYKKKVYVKQMLDNIQKGQTVRLAGAIKTHDVSQGDKAWMAARIIFVARGNDGLSMYNLPHILAARNASTDWESFSKIFSTSSDASSYFVEIQLLNVTGTMWVKNLSLKYVKETFSFSLFRIVSVLLWFLVTLWVLVPQRHTIFSSKWKILIIIMLIVALFGALVPAGLKHNAMNFMVAFFPWAGGGEVAFFRMGHFLVFCVLSMVVFRKAQPGHYVISAANTNPVSRPSSGCLRAFINYKIIELVQLVLRFCSIKSPEYHPEIDVLFRQLIFSATLSRFILLMVFAMVTEILQFLVDGRTPRVSDFFIDVSGIVLGFLISRMYLFYTNRGISRVRS